MKNRLTALVRKPTCWLLLVMVLVFIFYRQGKMLKLRRCPDSDSYLFKLTPLKESLGQARTIGYPVILNCAHALSPNYRYLPACQLALLGGAVFLFFGGLRAIGMPAWPAALISSTFFFTDVAMNYTGQLITDGPGASLAVATLGCLLLAVARPLSYWRWVGLAAVLFATYQVRPAYLFLVVLVPLLGVALRALVATANAVTYRRLIAQCLVVAFLPFLAFCSARWAIVGHFGIVSFGGENLIGIAGQFLTDDMVDELPEHVRPLAAAGVSRRQHTPSWQSALKGEVLATVDFDIMCAQYNATVWSHFVPAASQLATPETVGLASHQVEVNRKLGELSQAILQARPGLYVQWLGIAFVRSLKPLAVTNQAAVYFLWPLGAVLIAGHIAWLIRFVRSVPREQTAPATMLPYQILFLLTLTFTLSKLVLVILVEEPIQRYLDGAAVMLLSLPAAAVVLAIRRVFLTGTIPPPVVPNDRPTETHDRCFGESENEAPAADERDRLLCCNR